MSKKKNVFFPCVFLRIIPPDITKWYMYISEPLLIGRILCGLEIIYNECKLMGLSILLKSVVELLLNHSTLKNKSLYQWLPALSTAVFGIIFAFSSSLLTGWLRDVTGNYVASFMVAGSFVLLGSLTMTTLPGYFSCTDPPPPQRPTLIENSETLHLELGPKNSYSSEFNHHAVEQTARWNDQGRSFCLQKSAECFTIICQRLSLKWASKRQVEKKKQCTSSNVHFYATWQKY